MADGEAVSDTPSTRPGAEDGGTPPPPGCRGPTTGCGTATTSSSSGSGYGGAIAASRLARAGRSVCLLERGRELRPGDFPVHPGRRRRPAPGAQGRPAPRPRHRPVRPAGRRRPERPRRLRARRHVAHQRRRRAAARRLGLRRRPLARRAAGPGRRPRRAGALLRGGPSACSAPPPIPTTGPSPPSWPPCRRAANGVGATVQRPRINVTFTDGPNAAGVEQRACTLCGDCVTGCNHGAKNTVADELPARRRRPRGRGVLRGRGRAPSCPRGTAAAGSSPSTSPADGRARFDAPASFVFADVVVLAAGTLGSTEILLRSRDRGPGHLPARLGGASAATATSWPSPTTSRTPTCGGSAPAGRTVTARERGRPVHHRHDRPHRGRHARPGSLLIEEGAIPGALRAADAGRVRGGGRRRRRRRPRRRSPGAWRAGVRATAGAVLDPTGGPADRSLTYLVMSDDAGDGRLRPRRRRAAGRVAGRRRPARCSTTTPTCCGRPRRRWAPSSSATRCGRRCCTTRS